MGSVVEERSGVVAQQVVNERGLPGGERAEEQHEGLAGLRGRVRLGPPSALWNKKTHRTMASSGMLSASVYIV